jgi:hypothetical protein
MAVQLIGNNEGAPPFNRTFFNVTLGGLVDPNGKEKPVKLTLFLSDGSTLDVCRIDSLSDDYLSARAYQGNNDNCELNVHLIPYGLIYRIEISPKAVGNGGRVGFNWHASPKKKSRT